MALDLRNCDCMQMMTEYPDKYFELAIVDPPYGIGAGTITMGKGSGNDTGRNKLKNWDVCVPDSPYFIELKRVSKNQIIWGGNYFDLPPSRCFLIWDKMDYNSDFASAELAWTSFDKVVKTFRFSRSANSNNAVVPDMYKSFVRIHPCQKPIELYKWLLHGYAKQGDKILDTHLGSGSIAIACHDYKFDLTASEIDKEYFDATIKRVNNHISQTVLF